MNETKANKRPKRLQCVRDPFKSHRAQNSMCTGEITVRALFQKITVRAHHLFFIRTSWKFEPMDMDLPVTKVSSLAQKRLDRVMRRFRLRHEFEETRNLPRDTKLDCSCKK